MWSSTATPGPHFTRRVAGACRDYKWDGKRNKSKGSNTRQVKKHLVVTSGSPQTNQHLAVDIKQKNSVNYMKKSRRKGRSDDVNSRSSSLIAVKS